MDAYTLDQFRVFVTVAEEGSFSAAARRLNRAQSAITYAVQNLETGTGTPLFDRSAYRPALTLAGRTLLPRAKRILEDVADWQRQARSLQEGVEARLTIAVEMAAPTDFLSRALRAFDAAFPMVELSLLVHPPETTLAILRDGRADLGLVIEIPVRELLNGLERVPCGRMDFVPVAAPDHPLARLTGTIPRETLRSHTQLLLSTGHDASAPRTSAAHAVNLWRVNDLTLRHSLLLAGIGWGNMPRHLIAEDLTAGRLRNLTLDRASLSEQPSEIPLSVAHPRGKALGPAGRWLLERLIDEGMAGAVSGAPPDRPDADAVGPSR